MSLFGKDRNIADKSEGDDAKTDETKTESGEVQSKTDEPHQISSQKATVNTPRINTYIKGFDNALEGGIPEGFSVLLSGGPGTMKSSIAFNILYNETIKGRKCVYVMLEQPALMFLKQIKSLNFDLSKVNLVAVDNFISLKGNIEDLKKEKNPLVMVSLGKLKEKMKASTIINFNDILINNITSLVNNKLCDILVIDSVSALLNCLGSETMGEAALRKEFFKLIEALHEFGLTTILIHEKIDGISNYMEYSLSDGVISISTTRRDLTITREISVVKMRATNTNMNVFMFEFNKMNGFEVYSKMRF